MKFLASLMVAVLAVASPALAADSICVKYGTADQAKQVELMTTIVGRAVLGTGANATGTAVQGIISPSGPIRGYFDGSMQTRPVGVTPNFIDSYVKNGLATGNGTAPFAFGVLAAHLVQFFGTAIGCGNGATDGTNMFNYQGEKNMTLVHSKMTIKASDNQYFITQLVNTLKSLGVADADIQAVGGVLANFNLQPGTTGKLICNQADCPCAPGWQGDKCLTATPTGAAFGVRPSMVAAAVAIVAAGLLL